MRIVMMATGDIAIPSFQKLAETGEMVALITQPDRPVGRHMELTPPRVKVVAEQLGIPINNVMRAQSEQLRVERSQQAKEKGMKASIKMLLPMLLFIFPVVFIILMGPTVMNIMETF
jgi:methionyl-tRNA formyltransferase